MVNWTDKQADRQTDRQTDGGRTAQCMQLRGKIFQNYRIS